MELTWDTPMPVRVTWKGWEAHPDGSAAGEPETYSRVHSEIRGAMQSVSAISRYVNLELVSVEPEAG